MNRPALLAALAILAACDRSRGVADQDLGALVKETRHAEAPIDVDRAAKDPAELGRALAQPHAATIAALGPHAYTVASTMATAPGASLTDKSALELGEQGAWHGTYTNSEDYGREAIFVGGRLFLRPRYQRWHGRAPESPDEPTQLRDAYADAVAAAWDLLAPGAELTDRGAAQVAGRAGKKIAVALAPGAHELPREALTQRKWRETRAITALSGEVVLDAEKGVPLSVQLSGTVGFQRDGKHYDLKITVDASVSAIGTAAAIAAPAEGDVVATPERLREVEDRDSLLRGIAPPAAKAPAAKKVAP